MDFHISVVGIGLAREQGLQFAPRHLALQLLERLFRLGDGFLVLLGLAKLDHGELIVELAFDALEGGKLVLQRGAFLHHALGALLIVPELWVFGLLVKIGETRARLVRVKDASSAARSTA